MKNLLLSFLFLIIVVPFAFTQDAKQLPVEDLNAAEEYDEEKIDAVEHATNYQKRLKIAPATTPLPFYDRQIEPERWRQLSDNPIFNYSKLETKDIEPKQPSRLATLLANIFLFFTTPTGRTILWTLTVLAIVSIVYTFVRSKAGGFFSKRDKKFANSAEVIAKEAIPDDWNVAINQAVNQGDLRLAVRLMYRQLIWLLAEGQYIEYKPAKTNYQYLYELRNSEYYHLFMNMTRRYEYVWYGGFGLRPGQYEEFEQIFYQIKQKL